MSGVGIGLDLPIGLPLKMARERDVLSWEALGCTGKDLSWKKNKWSFIWCFPLTKAFFFFFLLLS